jgi:hypothetical protein
MLAHAGAFGTAAALCSVQHKSTHGRPVRVAARAHRRVSMPRHVGIAILISEIRN